MLHSNIKHNKDAISHRIFVNFINLTNCRVFHVYVFADGVENTEKVSHH